MKLGSSHFHDFILFCVYKTASAALLIGGVHIRVFVKLTFTYCATTSHDHIAVLCDHIVEHQVVVDVNSPSPSPSCFPGKPLQPHCFSFLSPLPSNLHHCVWSSVRLLRGAVCEDGSHFFVYTSSFSSMFRADRNMSEL